MKLQQLLSRTRKAIEDFHMIEEGDKIAIGISGGKDSLTLLYALSYLRKFYPKKFEIIAVTVDVGFGNLNLEKIRELCQQLKVEYHVIETQIAQVVFDVREESNPCSLCAKMRKGALNNKVKELGCNKVAYAHHKDDLIETMMMSFLFEGRLHTFSPVTYWDRSGLTLIRPLLYMYEGDVKGFVKEMDLPVVKSSCPVDGSTKREYAKEIVNQLNREHPGSKAKMYRAIMDGLVIPDLSCDEQKTDIPLA
ncbi:MAG: ATP-binding protein [Eubacteriales bacterium]|nr:ATP-binding protein [Eubacteriales bacterium]